MDDRDAEVPAPAGLRRARSTAHHRVGIPAFQIHHYRAGDRDGVPAVIFAESSAFMRVYNKAFRELEAALQSGLAGIPHPARIAPSYGPLYAELVSVKSRSVRDVAEALLSDRPEFIRRLQVPEAGPIVRSTMQGARGLGRRLQSAPVPLLKAA